MYNQTILFTLVLNTWCSKRPEVERFLCYSNHNASIGSKISAAESFFSSK